MQAQVVTLGGVCELIIDSEHKTAPSQDKGYPYIRTPNIGRGFLILEDVRRVSEQTYEEWTRRAVPEPGDLILAREAPVGNVAIIPEPLRVCLGQRTVLLRPNRRQVDPRYLNYLLLGDEMQARMAAMSSGSTVAHLNMSDIRSLSLPALPPLRTQRQIAAILSAYDDLIENNTRRIAILEEMARLIYREWFVHFRFPGHEDVEMVETEVGLVPEGWGVVPLKNVAAVNSGFAFKSETYDDGGRYGLVTISNVQDGVFEKNFRNRIGRPPDKMKDFCYLTTGDILLSLTGNIGRVCLVHGDDLLLNQRVGKIVPCEDILRAYLYLMFRQSDFTARLERIATGVAQQNLGLTGTRNLRCIVPDRKLIAEFASIVDPIIDQILVLWRQNEKLRETRDLLLPRLVSGEAEVSEVDVAGVR